MRRSDFVKAISLLGLSNTTTLSAFSKGNPKRSLRVAFMTDMHVKPVKEIEEGTSRAFRNVHKQKDIDFIINGGDSIMDALAIDKTGTQQQWAVLQGILAKENKLPIYHCIGNHDVWGWFIKEDRPETDALYGKAWVLQELRMPNRYYRFQKNKWHFIVLDSTQLNQAGGYIGKLDDEQLNWLQKELDIIPKDEFICIASHIPILSICAGLFFDKTEPNGDLKIQRNLMHTDFLSLKKLFLKYPNIKVCLSGHIHLQDELDYLGIKYYCNGAVSGNWWKGSFQEFAPAYAIIEFGDDGTSNRTIINY